jgi:phosphopantetheinyl transferase (holo-ACP synthase)
MDNCSSCGNDIIDLSCHPEKEWRRTRFLSKILTDAEQQYFLLHPEIELLPEWLFTCKESAYKYFVKQGCRDAFNPRSFEVDLAEYEIPAEGVLYKGKIRCSYGTCLFISEVIPLYYIHSVCCSEKYPDKTLSFVERDESALNAGRSKVTRSAMIHFIKKNFAIDSDNIDIINDPATQIPFLYINGKKAPYDISMSHDGSYYAGCVLKLPGPVH